MRRILGALGLVAVLAAAAIADTVTKTDGTVVEGDVTAETDDAVTIKCKLGELKIPRAEVAKIERSQRYDAEADLDVLKGDALRTLGEIAGKCDDAKLVGKAKAARALAEQVRGWNLVPPREKPDEKKAPPPTKSGDKDTFRAIWNKWRAISYDSNLTDVQRQKALGLFRAEHEGKRFAISMKVSDIRRDDDYASGAPRAQVTGEIWSPNQTTTLYFSEAPDVERLEKAAKGATLTFETTLTCSPGMGEPQFLNPRGVSVR